jgi:hypothetical protein
LDIPGEYLPKMPILQPKKEIPALDSGENYTPNYGTEKVHQIEADFGG